MTNDLWAAISYEWDATQEVESSSSSTTSSSSSSSSAAAAAAAEVESSSTKQHNFTVREMMDTWTLQMGYPLVTFEQMNGTR